MVRVLEYNLEYLDSNSNAALKLTWVTLASHQIGSSSARMKTHTHQWNHAGPKAGEISFKRVPERQNAGTWSVYIKVGLPIKL